MRTSLVALWAIAAAVGCHGGGGGPGLDVLPVEVDAGIADGLAREDGAADASTGSEDAFPVGDYFYVSDLGVILCMSPDECPEGYLCERGRCIECRDRYDCESRLCRADGTCVPPTCVGDDDCKPYFCVEGRCVECRTAEDCWPNQYCDAGSCKVSEPCTSDPDCPEGHCISGVCEQWECADLGDFKDTCPPEQFCHQDFHICVPDVCPAGLGICHDERHAWICAPDGSGFLVSNCMEGWTCVDGHCREVEVPPPVCDPTCEGRECGVDGCGNLCGACEVGKTCEEGHCVPVNHACFPREDPGCPDCPCEGLVCKQDPECCSEHWGWGCAKKCDEYDPSFSCPECSTLLPAGCGLRECGVEPCGAFCGPCAKGGHCVLGTCLPGVPPDMGRACKSAGECASGLCEPVGPGAATVCTAGCGEGVECPSGWSCEDGLCRVKPDCLGTCQNKRCGVDECGSPCGSCPQGKVCTMANLCEAPGDGCDATPGIPTCGGCACQACVCAWMPSCCLEEWSHMCASYCRAETCDPLGVMKAACASPGAYSCAELGFECGLVATDGGMPFDCGSCAAGWTCVGHKCECQPQCEGRVCGPDGCGGWCGQDDSVLPPLPPAMEVFCEDGQWKFVPEACFVGTGPSCIPGPQGWDCMDYDCVCDAMPLCCPSSGGPGFWEQACVDYAMAFCGLDCDPQPWRPNE